ncbi:MAG: LacI family transcriptional regulator [Victivallaceae bacterium]|nr:LacI family transcriptional regulator [Victivallaceae bacterium]
MKKRVTIADVAAACGTSSMTVSRALRQKSRINPETRARILKTAQKLGYFRQTRQGRPGAGQEPQKIQLLVGFRRKSVPIFSFRLLIALEQRLAERGYVCLTRFANGDYCAFTRMLDSMRNTESAATVAIGDFQEKQLLALQCALPGLLLLDNPGIPDDDAAYSSLTFDNIEAAHLQVEHLLSRGRKRILLLNGPGEHSFARELETGYRQTLAAHKIPVDPALIAHCDFSPGDAAEVLKKVLASGVVFDAIATTDELAVAAVRVLRQKGLEIPGDVAICGCDNIPLSEQLFPTLTTVALDYDHLAELAVNHLCGDTSGLPVRRKLPPTLLVRLSS